MTDVLTSLAREYAAALEAHLRGRSGEASLSQAYELGRRALTSGLGVLDMAGVHQDAALALVLAAPAGERTHYATAANDFLRELLSPFEMTFRGYRSANEQLQRLNEALLHEKDAVEAANKELETFSYSVSHDLRAPLRSIDGFSAALSEDCADSLDARGRKYLGYIRDSARLMAQLIDDLLQLARVTRAEMNRFDLNLAALAHGVLERLRASTPERQVEVVLADPLMANGDDHLLAVVMDNLLRNAWKFTSKKQYARIEVGQRREGRRTVFFVKDNGAGFDMAYVGKLFGAFQRLHSADDFPGTGVGLATVQRIVHRHGGKIWAEGAVGQGATFFFTLKEDA